MASVRLNASSGILFVPELRSNSFTDSEPPRLGSFSGRLDSLPKDEGDEPLLIVLPIAEPA